MSRHDPVFDNYTVTFRQKLEQTMNLPSYQAASPAVRATMLEAIQHAADKIGADRMFEDRPDFAQRMTEWTSRVNQLKYSQ
jgi:hypothetical protein